MAKVKEFSARDAHELVMKKLKHYSTEGEHTTLWMDTGEPELNAVLGSRVKGIPYGRMIEIAGGNSNGKTLLTLHLAAQAQAEGAFVGWMAFEDPFDYDWAKLIGLDPEKIAIFEPFLGKFGTESEERMATGEELFDEVDRWMMTIHKKNPNAKIFVACDSIAAIVTEMEDDAGVTGQNMRTNNSTPMFLSKLLKRWAGRLKVCNTMLVLINQIRTKPMAFGNPEYTPGGNALKFHCSIRAYMRRKGAKGKMMKSGKIIGIKGVLENIKNKCGSGSIEGEKAGYKLFFSGNAKFIPINEFVKE